MIWIFENIHEVVFSLPPPLMMVMVYHETEICDIHVIDKDCLFYMWIENQYTDIVLYTYIVFSIYSIYIHINTIYIVLELVWKKRTSKISSVENSQLPVSDNSIDVRTWLHVDALELYRTRSWTCLGVFYVENDILIYICI